MECEFQIVVIIAPRDDRPALASKVPVLASSPCFSAVITRSDDDYNHGPLYRPWRFWR
jgi:hypothetical protein